MTFPFPTMTLPEIVGEAGLLTDGDWVESKDQDESGAIRLTQLADVGDGEFLDRSDRWLNEEQAARLGVTYLAPGDVLVARMPDPLGRACVCPALPTRAITVVDVCVVRAPAHNARWIMHALNAPQTRSRVAGLQSGSTRKRISKGNLSTIPIPMPPRETQDRLVAAIDMHLSRLDAAVASLTRAKANVANARASVLKAAVEGRLVPAGWAAGRLRSHAGESAEALVRRVAAERKQRWLGAGGRGKWKEAAPPESDRLGPLPDGWTWARCEQLLCELQTGPFGSSLHASDYVEGGVPVVNPQHLQDGRIVPMGNVSVSRETAARLSAFALRAGDIVLGRRGEMGRCAVVGPREAGWMLGTGSLALRLESGIDREYFAMALRSPGVVRQLEGDSVGTTMNNLNQRILLDLPIPLAPAQDQPRIVAEVERRQSVLDEVARSLDADLARCVRLRQAILKLAFEGRLVPEVTPSMEVVRHIVPTAESAR